MCDKCTQMVKLIEQTKPGYSTVVASFPYGEARLVYTDEYDPINSSSTYTGVIPQVPDALPGAPG